MDDLLTVFGSSHIMGLDQILCSLLMSFVLSSVFATVYYKTFQSLSYSRAFVQTMILGSMIVCMLIMAIGNNLARGLGILGTLAIIRFRTPIRDPRDMIFLFASLATGIACGAATYGVAIVGTICINIAALALHWSPFASRRDYEGLLRFLMPTSSNAASRVQGVLQECCAAFYLIAMREASQGDMVEYSYQVRLIDPSYQAEIIEKLHALEDVTEANLLMQRTTVEL